MSIILLMDFRIVDGVLAFVEIIGDDENLVSIDGL